MRVTTVRFEGKRCLHYHLSYTGMDTLCGQDKVLGKPHLSKLRHISQLCLICADKWDVDTMRIKHSTIHKFGKS